MKLCIIVEYLHSLITNFQLKLHCADKLQTIKLILLFESNCQELFFFLFTSLYRINVTFVEKGLR